MLRFLFKYFIILSTSILFVHCGDEIKPTVHGVFSDDSTYGGDDFDLRDIQASGELIVLSLYGPDTYFEFKGEEFGNQYRLAQAFAKTLGVKARISVCKTEKELIDKLVKGDGDVIAYDLPVDSLNENLHFCGKDVLNQFLDTLSVVEHDNSIKRNCKVAWAVRSSAIELANKLDDWLSGNNCKNMLVLSQPHVPRPNDNRHYTAYVSNEYFPDIPFFDDFHGEPQGTKPVHSSYTTNNRTSNTKVYSKGLISNYDELFKRYAPYCGLDWKLLAAMAYNESSFNPNAVSYMGAMGLMQLMPSTAKLYGVSNAFDPEQSVWGAAKVMSSLLAHYSSVPSADERINFALAAYNAGAGHVDDARRLAQKRGKDPNVWKDNVDEFVLYMSNPDCFNDPVVHYGYFRGGETYNYVNYIRKDWERYKNM